MRAVLPAKAGRQLHEPSALGARLLPPHLLHRQFASQILHGFHRGIGGKKRLGLEPGLARMAGLLLFPSLVESKAIGTAERFEPSCPVPTLPTVMPLGGRTLPEDEETVATAGFDRVPSTCCKRAIMSLRSATTQLPGVRWSTSRNPRAHDSPPDHRSPGRRYCIVTCINWTVSALKLTVLVSYCGFMMLATPRSWMAPSV